MTKKEAEDLVCHCRMLGLEVFMHKFTHTYWINISEIGWFDSAQKAWDRLKEFKHDQRTS